MTYRYVITHGVTDQVLKPIGSISITEKKAETEGGRNFFRTELSEITISATKDRTGYNFLLALEQGEDRCDPIELVVDQYINGGWFNRFTGKFNLNDCEFDLNTCQIFIKAKPNDFYQCLIDNENKEVNVMQAPTKVETNVVSFPTSWQNILFTITYDGATPAPLQDIDAIDVDWTFMYNITVDGVDLSVWIMFRIYTECLSGVGVEPAVSATWHQYTDCSGGFALWIAEVPPGDVGTWQTQTSLQTTIVEGCDLEVGIQLTMTDTEIGVPSPTGQCYKLTATPSTSDPIPNGLKLSDCLDYLIENTCSDVVGVISDFFQINPETSSSLNYVTGLGNPWIDPHIHQLSDVKNPTAPSPATRGIMTFKKLMGDLFKMFRVQWRIEESGGSNYIRIEHESYFESGTAQDYSSNPDKQYAYEKGKLFKEQRFYSYSDIQYNLDFLGANIQYSGSCVNDEIEEIRLELLCSDYDYIELDPDGDIPSIGFVIFAIEQGTDDALYGIGELTETFLQNVDMSWANLHQALHRHNRYNLTGTMNLEAQTFETAIRFKKQEIEERDCNFSISTANLITTKLGTGEIQQVQHDLGTGNAEIEILL